MGRMGPQVRAVGTEAFGELTGALVRLEPRLKGHEGEARARVAAATMVGALICARAVGDEALSHAILKDARERVIARLEVSCGI